MSLLAWPALLMLAAIGVLLALAFRGVGPRAREVGTLMIWRRVAESAAATQSRRRRLDVLLWLLLAVVLLGVLGAARPAVFAEGTAPRIAVFIERLDYSDEDKLRAAMERARELAPGANLEFFVPGAREFGDAELHHIVAGDIRAELAQFRTLGGEHDGRLLMLALPWGEAGEWGRVEPLVDEPRQGVIFEIRSEGSEINVRASSGGQREVAGATLVSASTSGGEASVTYEGREPQVSITDATGATWQLRRDPFSVGVGPDWSSTTHRALYEALGAEDATDGVDVWLGSREGSPAVRINMGAPVELAGAEFGFDPQHPLFAELPLSSFDWGRAGRLLPPVDGARPLVTATRDGEVLGDVVRLRGSDVIEFAGDPFEAAPIAAAALLLDNAIGVVTGEPPSRRPGYRLVGDEPLPSSRGALAAPFDPYGELPAEAQRDDPVELTTWLLLIAAGLLLGAGFLVARPSVSGPRRP